MWVLDEIPAADVSAPRIRWMTLPDGDPTVFDFDQSEVSKVTYMFYASNNFLYLTSSNAPRVLAKVFKSYNTNIVN